MTRAEQRFELFPVGEVDPLRERLEETGVRLIGVQTRSVVVGRV